MRTPRPITSTLALLSIVALGACTGARAPASVSPAPPPKIVAPACPTGDALVEVARAAWAKGAGTVEARCFGWVSAGEPVWLIDGVFVPPDDPAKASPLDEVANYWVGSWMALTRPDGYVLWRDGSDHVPSMWVRNNVILPFTNVDLDGDGEDELVGVAGDGHAAYETGRVVVLRVHAHTVTPIDDGVPLFDNDQSGLNEGHFCPGDWALVPGPNGIGKDIAVDYGRAACKREGHHLWRLFGNHLIDHAD